MSPVTTEILFIFLLVLANGLFAMSEMAIISSRKARLQQLANKGNFRASAALDLANTPNRFLSTVQIGITLVGILAGAFGGATLSEKLSVYLKSIPLLSPYHQGVSLAVVVLGITYLSLIIGELVPKRMALQHPEAIACMVAIPMGLLSTIASPIVHLLSHSTELLLKLIGIGPSKEPAVTEEEIKILLEQGTQAGTFEEAEQDIVERVFRLGDQQVAVLMTPRPDIIWLDLEDSLAENQRQIVESGCSRYPVCQGTLDEVVGIIHLKDVIANLFSGEPFDLTTDLKQPLFVPESTRALRVMELFKQSGNHLALVVDEYGVIQGLVTLNDVLEAIVGDIPSSDESNEPQAVQREDGSWLVDGLMAADDFREMFDLFESPDDEKGNYQTLGGFVIMNLGRIPAVADHFSYQGTRIEVVDMDGNRIDKVLVIPPQSTTTDS